MERQGGRERERAKTVRAVSVDYTQLSDRYCRRDAIVLFLSIPLEWAEEMGSFVVMSFGHSAYGLLASSRSPATVDGSYRRTELHTHETHS